MPDDMTTTVETPTIGHNAPPKTMTGILDANTEDLRARYNELMGAEARLPEAVQDEDTAAKINKLVKQCRDHIAVLENSRKAAQKPYDEKVKTIRAYYKPLTDALDGLRKRADELVNAYQTEKARKTREEAERLRREADEKEKAASDDAAQQEAARLAARAEQTEATGRTIGGDTSNGYMRKDWTVHVRNRSALIKAVAAGEIDETILTVDEAALKKMAQAGIESVPGVEFELTEKWISR